MTDIESLRTADGYRVIDIPIGSTVYRLTGVGNVIPETHKVTALKVNDRGQWLSTNISEFNAATVREQMFVSHAAALRTMAQYATNHAMEMMQRAAAMLATESLAAAKVSTQP